MATNSICQCCPDVAAHGMHSAVWRDEKEKPFITLEYKSKKTNVLIYMHIYFFSKAISSH